MKVLIGCEESQEVCKAFRALGYEAYSCDLQECSGGHPEWHIQGDVFEAIESIKPDLLIGHPPCDYIAYVGAPHWNLPGRVFKRLEALYFFAKLWEAPIPYICLENPKSCASPVIAKYSQEIQPYYFGDSDMKETWLWLRGLPLLQYSLSDNLFSVKTSVQKPEPIYIDYTGEKRYRTDSISGTGKDAKMLRARFFPGIAKAMAEQWGGYVSEQLKKKSA